MLGRTRFGVIPLGEGGEARVRAFVSALAKTLDTDIDVHYAADYRALASALEQGLVHLAWLPPLAAARSVRARAANPLAIAVRHGATSYFTGLIALESRGLRTAKDLRNLRAAWVDRESASGYVVIRAALRAQGLSLVDAFAEDIFCRNHAEVLRAVASGRADVGATCFNPGESDAIQLGRSAYTNPENGSASRLVVIDQAGPIPSDIFAVHHSVSPITIARLETALVGARPAHLFDSAKTLMFADSFARPEGEHVRMLDALYDLVLADPTRRSAPPPARATSSIRPQ